MILHWRNLTVLCFAGLVAVTSTGCPEDQFDANTWVKKLDDSKEVERAVTELERLGDPKANGLFTVIDISGDQPKIVGTVDIGHENLEGAMMSNDGKWVAGVAHGGSTRPKDAPQFKPNGMLVMYRLDGDKLTKVSEMPIGAWSQGVSFSKDGKTVAAQNMLQKNIQVFKNDDGKLTDTGQKIEVGGGAAAIRSSTDR